MIGKKSRHFFPTESLFKMTTFRKDVKNRIFSNENEATSRFGFWVVVYLKK